MTYRKYRNEPITINGESFDSKKEAHRYWELQLLERAGKISELRRQVKFELAPAKYESYPRYGKKGQRLAKDGTQCIETSCNYVADFTYLEDGHLIVEDVKGYRDPSSAGYAKFVVKRKWMLDKYGIRIREV